jgi:cytochrome c-type biogenesis protein CcmH/NrfG
MDQRNIAIAVAGFLLLIALVGLAVTAKDKVNQIEQGGQVIKKEPGKEAESSSNRLLTGLLVLVLVLGVAAALYKVWQEYLRWQTVAPRTKEPWELD